MRENLIEKALVAAVKRHGGLCWKLVSPGTRGVPDRIVMTSDGRTIYVETKAPMREMSEIQKHRYRQLQDRKHQVAKLDSLESVGQFVRAVFGGCDAK